MCLNNTLYCKKELELGMENQMDIKDLNTNAEKCSPLSLVMNKSKLVQKLWRLKIDSYNFSTKVLCMGQPFTHQCGGSVRNDISQDFVNKLGLIVKAHL